MIREIPIGNLQPSPMNTFNLYPADKMTELAASISNAGQLEPVIVRPADCCETYDIDRDYEIIAGHNRYQALKKLGIKAVKCDVVDADDVTASLIIGQSNIQRDISEIETARSYRQTYELMKKPRGGDRRSSFHEENMNDGKDRTLEKLAEMYGIAPSTMYRKIRLTYLIPEVLDKYEKKKITQKQAVQISFADRDMQMALMDNYSSTDRNWINDSRANAFGMAARQAGGHITPNQIREIMSKDFNDTGIERDNTPARKERKYPVPAYLFPGSLMKKDRPEYLVKALEYIRSNNIVL